MNYSQNDEEKHILSYFGERKGHFLDIGAHDGVTLSNTRALFERGWTGTLVEPSPAPFVKLMENYRDAPSMNLVHLAVVPEASRVLGMKDSRGDFVSTFDAAHEKLWASVQFQEIFVYGSTVAALLMKFPGPYQFVNIDVEGINFEIFSSFPLRELGAELVCVEYQNKLREIETLAMVQGYKRIHVTTENVILGI